MPGAAVWGRNKRREGMRERETREPRHVPYLIPKLTERIKEIVAVRRL